MVKWKRILVATDFSPAAEAALRTAERIARASDGAEIVAVHVVEPPPPFYTPLLARVGPPEVQEEWVVEPRRRMAGLVAGLRKGGRRARGVVRVGIPWREVVRLAVEVEADGLCIGTSGHSPIERLLLGSTAENVLRDSPVPVLVTREKPVASVRRVLLPIDLDEGSRRVVRFALERFAERVRLDALFVLPSFPTYMPETWPTSLDRTEYEIRAREFLDHEGGKRIGLKVVTFQDPAWTILAEIQSRRPDLVVVATHGRRGMARMFFGSVSEKVVRHAECPVLVLPGPPRETAAEPRRRKAGELEGEVAPAKRPRRRPAGPGPDLSEGEIRLRASVTHEGRGPWTGQAHTGRGGPEGRRGSGHKAGRPGGRTKGGSP